MYSYFSISGEDRGLPKMVLYIINVPSLYIHGKHSSLQKVLLNVDICLSIKYGPTLPDHMFVWLVNIQD